MTITELKEQIVKNELSNFYIFAGQEIGIINIYLEQMSNKYNVPITRASSVLSIYNACTSRTIFGKSKGFYVIRDDKDFIKQEGVYETISKDIGENVIVLLYEKLDSRTKFAKHFSDKIVTFEKLPTSVLVKYIQNASGMSDENCVKLAEICDNSYDTCMLEVDKLKNYVDSFGSGKVIPVDIAFAELCESGVIYQKHENTVFDFAEAVCTRNCKRAFLIEKNLRDNGISAINILGTLYNSMKSVMLIQACNSNDIAGTTGLDKGQIYFNKKYIRYYNIEDLVYNVKTLANIISSIKSGEIEDEYATRYALMNIL